MSESTNVEIEARVEHAVDTAIASFWEIVVEQFPEITGGDMDPMYEGVMYAQATEWIEHWLSLNSKDQSV